MNEVRKRKEWIKNIAIIFLVIMLLLTFFSNTIMNYSLPQVATQYVERGSITAKVRGTGTVTASDPYNVVVNEGRKISSVAVRQGDIVEKGDVIYYLEDGDSSELTKAQSDLDALILAYEAEMLTGDISGDVYNHVQSGAETSLASYQQLIESSRARIASAEATVKAYETSVKNLQNQIAILEASYVDTSKEQKNLDTAKTNLANAQADLANKQTEYNSSQEVVDSYKITITEADAAVAAAQTAYDNAVVAGGNTPSEAQQTAINEALAALNTAKSLRDNLANALNRLSNAYNAMNNSSDNVQICQAAVNSAQKALDDKLATATADATLNNFKYQLVAEQAKLDAANAALTDATEQQTELLANIQAELKLGAQYDAIQAQRELVEELQSKSIGSTVVAPISGTIDSIAHVAGESFAAGDTVAVMQSSEKGKTLTMTVTTDQAKQLSVGDVAEISSSWYYYDVAAAITAIKPDPQNPATNRIVEFAVTGDVATGTTLTLSVGQKSADYDLIVPNNAIREDSNGKFILIVESKSSPLGNRYIATRVDVQVLASDDTKTAISGALYGYEYVITTSTKPVEAGKQVRLAD